MRIDGAPVSAALRRSTLEAARALRRRRLSIFGAAATMGLATAAVACILLLPGLWHAAGPAGPGGTGDAGTAAPDSTQTAEATGAPQAAGQPLSYVAVPLRAVSGGPVWEGVGYDGAFNVLIEPGKLDDTLGQYHLIEDGRDSTAAEKLAALRSSQNELRLVLATNPSSTPRLNAVGLTLAQGELRFTFTDCTNGDPPLYGALDEAIGNYGFLVEVPPEAAGLPFASASVPWGEVGSQDKIAVMLERILTNAEAEAYLSTAKLSREAAARAYLEKSPMETAGILSMGQQAVDWLTARRDALQQAGTPTLETDVISLLIEYMGDATPLPDTNTGAPADSSPEGAFRRDLDTHILEDGGAPAGDGVRQYYYILPLYQKDEGRIVAAVLASVQRGEGEKPGEPQVFLVDARYTFAGADRQLDGWTITPDPRPGPDNYDTLRYRGWDSQLYTMYAELNTQLSGLVDKPFSPRLDNAGGQTVKLAGATGTLRWYRLSKWVVLEKGAGSNNIDIDVQGFPDAGSIAGDLAPLAGGKWKKVSEKDYEKANATPDKAGFAGAWLELTVAADEGLWYYSFRFNYDKENVTLWRWLLTADGRGQTTECYVSTDLALYGKMMAALRVSTDVSDLLIDSAPGPKLPQDREELKYLVAYVQDMPGGIAEIKPAILYGDGSGGLTEEKLDGPKGEREIVAWAEALRTLLSGDEWAVKQIDGLPETMAAEAGKGRPAMLRWDVVPAAQEGKASLTIWANPVTHQVWSKTVYRLYGTTTIHTWYTATAKGDGRLYSLLTKLTFGHKITDPNDLPQ